MSRAIPWIEIQVPQENISTKKVDNKLPPHKKKQKKNKPGKYENDLLHWNGKKKSCSSGKAF